MERSELLGELRRDLFAREPFRGPDITLPPRGLLLDADMLAFGAGGQRGAVRTRKVQANHAIEMLRLQARAERLDLSAPVVSERRVTVSLPTLGAVRFGLSVSDEVELHSELPLALRARAGKTRTMAGWRIVSFDRARGQGVCASGVGTLAFDAHVARVDDFTVGEGVDVSLRAVPGGFEVIAIAPTTWRAPFHAKRRVSLVAQLDAIAAQIARRRVWLHRFEDELLALQVEDDTYSPERALVFAGARYVMLPTELDEVVALHAFAMADVAREAPALVAHWPTIGADETVFRLDPRAFGQPAAYVVAVSIGLQPL